MSLHRLVQHARGADPHWDTERANRVLAATVIRRERREARSRLVRRSLSAVGAASLVVALFLRGAGASTNEATPTHESVAPTIVAVHDDPLNQLGDGGYGRD